MKRVVFTFGRMNPPTVGHQKVVDKVATMAKKIKGEGRIYLSHTQNDKKDPLSYDDKIRIAKRAFEPAVKIVKTKSKVIFHVLKELYDQKFTDIVLIVGDDRIQEFREKLLKYNGKGDYDFNTIGVISAGKRDPDAVGLEGMSASKLRALAKAGEYNKFASGLPKKLTPKDAKFIYDTIRKVIKEEMERTAMKNFNEFEQDISESGWSPERAIQFIDNRSRLLKDKIAKVEKDKKEIEDFFTKIYAVINREGLNNNKTVANVLAKLEKDVHKVVDKRTRLR